MARPPKIQFYKKYTKGRQTYGHPTVFNREGANLFIGSFCSIAANVTIMLGGNHMTGWITTYPFRGCMRRGHPSSKGDVVIGNDVWIGRNATILSGVTIGDGAVIGAGAVVAKSVEPYGIAVGNPARVVKKRFSDVQIRDLLSIKWWDWSDEKIRVNKLKLMSPDVDAFIREHLPQCGKETEGK